LAWESEADTLRGQLEATETRLRGIDQKLAEREPLEPPELAAEARPVEPMPSEPAPSEANPAVSAPNTSAEVRRNAEGIAELARRGISGFGRVLASAGVNVASLFSRFGMNHAEGGPFVPPPRGDQSAGSIVPDGLATIRSLAKALPLSTPLERYQVGSRFGPRRDPFNGRPAYHTGLDFDAAYMLRRRGS
jgi:murein DD-endopeptidase MepM/ murein hydrolase activator NlpD